MCRQIVFLAAAALLLGITSHATAQQDPNLFGWWKLDEGQGTVVADLSGKGHNGTINLPNGGKGPGGATWMEDAERGWCLSFNGDNTNGTYVVTTATIPALGLTSDFSWVFWCKQASAGGGVNQTMLGNRYGGTASPLQFIKFTPTKFEYYNDDTAYSTSITYAVPMPDGEWVHNAGVKKGNTLTYYRNGVQMGASTTVDKTMDANPFYIGGDPQGERWNGQLSDVKLFNRALTAEEVKAMGSQPKARKPNPANGALDVAMPLLQWTAGEGALFHDIYLGTTPDLTATDLKAPRYLMAMYYYVQGFTPGATYYWRVDEIEKDNVTVHAGDVWTFTVQDVTAYHPVPGNKANDAAPTPTLTWLPGQGAVKHTVFFSDSLDAVTQGTEAANKGTLAQAEAAFAPGDLDSLKTYYWRVDETVAGGLKAGPVWSFTTFLSVDDFESYTDQAGSSVFDVWIDGFTDGLSGSTVGKLTAANGTYCETGIVHGGLQSMPMDYNNVKSPFYSEAQQEFAPTQDWTADEADTLVLYVRGAPGNQAAPLYVALEDASKKAAMVVHADAAIVTTTKWTEWQIPLSSFTGVNLAKVKKIYIGVGDKNNATAGGSGTIYVDDIRVTRPAGA